jgi:hypothetical protein
MIRQGSYYGAWMFQKAEQFNRMQTFTAAFRLEREKALAALGLTNMEQTTPEQHAAVRQSSFEAARGAVEGSQFEYARWNRPEFMRQKRSAFFLFWNYLQNILYFAAKDPGRLRFALMLMLFAGLQGLPFAEDILDVVDLAATKFKQNLGYKNPKVDLRKDAREFIKELGGNPDLILHGLSHNTFGLAWAGDMMGLPIPEVNFSPSLSLGRVVPGLEPLVRSAETGFSDTRGAIQQSATEVGGAMMAVPMGLLQAVSSRDPDEFKRWETAMPSAVKAVARAGRYALTGEETDRVGAKIIDFDPKDIEHWAEITGQALGVQPTRIAREREMRWAQREHARYYQTRRELLQRQFTYALLSNDQQSQDEALQNIRSFNGSVPHRSLAISADGLRQSVRSRLKQRQMSEQGLPANRRDVPLAQEIEEIYSSERGPK